MGRDFFCEDNPSGRGSAPALLRRKFGAERRITQAEFISAEHLKKGGPARPEGRVGGIVLLRPRRRPSLPPRPWQRNKLTPKTRPILGRVFYGRTILVNKGFEPAGRIKCSRRRRHGRKAQRSGFASKRRGKEMEREMADRPFQAEWTLTRRRRRPSLPPKPWQRNKAVKIPPQMGRDFFVECIFYVN